MGKALKTFYSIIYSIHSNVNNTLVIWLKTMFLFFFFLLKKIKLQNWLGSLLSVTLLLLSFWCFVLFCCFNFILYLILTPELYHPCFLKNMPVCICVECVCVCMYKSYGSMSSYVYMYVEATGQLRDVSSIAFYFVFERVSL